MAKPKNITKEERLEKKRIAERLRYQKIKNDPTKLAAQKEKSRQKYLTRKEKGQRKLVSNMSDREKRQARKKWRNYSKTHYDKKTALEKAARKFVRENTPSSCDENVNSNQQQQVVNAQNVTPRLAQARKRALRQRKKRNQELQKKNDFIRSLKTKLQKYRKRYHRLKRERKEQLPQELTPCTKMKKLAENPDTRVEVVKKALFGDTLEKQLSENITNLSTKSEKRVANKLLMGRVVKKSKIWKLKNKLITYKKVWHSQKQNKLNEKTRKTFKNEVQKFLEDDQYSRLCAGKKEFITKNKVRKQKRYQLDTLRNLHKEFLKSGNVLISYSMFARLRPFWIVAPKVIDRDTCMCTLHSNIQLVVSALNTAKLLKDTSYQSLLTSLCCDRYNERCLERICELCSDKAISFSEDFDDTKLVTYQQWVSSREMIVDPKTKRERPVTKQKKENIETSARDLKVKLENDLVKLFKHELNIVHQYQSLKMIKQSLTEKDVVVHMDFSENYCTKYNEEIQSFHFGGSRTQLSLHTVVVYLKESTRSYCTVSTNLSHNVNAIWAHLKPVLEELPEKVENIHFLSDGPVTQYRNKYMFYVLACKIPDLCPGIINWTWNYTEAGHGKGAPDGVGAVCKRTADNIVAYGGNITNLNEFCGAIQTRCPNITLFVVNDSDIDDMSRLISEDQRSLIPFTGTLKVHQVQGNAYLPKRLIMKSLSCFCDNNGCEHYRLGLLKYSSESRNRVDAVYGNLDSERTEADSPTTSIMERRPFTESGRVQSGISELDNLSTMSNLSLNLENLEIFADMPDLEIDPTDLFPNETIASPTKAENSKKSIEVWLKTGRRHSDILQEQKQREGCLRMPGATIVLWLKCEQKIHDERLDKRVDSMLEQGLIQELLDFHDRHNKQRLKEGKPLDYTRGIFQTLGFKEFHDYLMLSEAERQTSQELLQKSVENMKMATRRYARRQNKMVKGRFLEHPNREVPPIYELDTTDVSAWDTQVKNKAIDIIESYLNGAPSEYKPLMSEIKETKKSINPFSNNYCEVCKRVFIGDKEYGIHLKSNRHMKVIKKRKLEEKKELQDKTELQTEAEGQI